MRSTRAHNTVEIAGADQCEFFGAFRVGATRPAARRVGRALDDGLELAAWHDGYRRLPGRPVHHRELGYAAEGALAVWDTVDSRVPHARHIARPVPAGSARPARGERTRTIDADGVALALRAFGGALSLEMDHYAPRFGERLACPVLALHARAGLEFGYVLSRRGARGADRRRGGCHGGARARATWPARASAAGAPA